MLMVLPWLGLLPLFLTHVAVSVVLLTVCGGKKKDDKGGDKANGYNIGKNTQSKTETNDKAKAPAGGAAPAVGGAPDAPADPKAISNKSKKKGKESEKPADKKGPTPGAVIPAINKEGLVPGGNDAVKTERKGDGGGDKDKIVSNPIVSQVTDMYPTVAEALKELKSERTQSDVETDKTQKDPE